MLSFVEEQKMKFVLSEYIEQTMNQAEFDKLEDKSFSGRIPACKGVIAFGVSLKECEAELRSVLEDWILVGLKLHHRLPIINDINLNKEPHDESMVTV